MTINKFKIKETGETGEFADDLARASATAAADNAEFNRQLASNIYGGQNLATLFASEIKGYASAAAWFNARCRVGNYAGMRIGDYFDITMVDSTVMRYRIGAFDHYYGAGDISIGHGAIMVPDTTVSIKGDWAVNGSYLPWNTTATNQGAADETSPYMASNLKKWEQEFMLNNIPQEWRNVIKNGRALVETRYSAAGALTEPDGWKWVDLGAVWSPSEVEVYGQNVWSAPGYGTGFDSQFPIFKETKNRIKARIGWWLRSVPSGSSSNVCYVHTNGNANDTSAAHDWIRPLPCFLVGV